MNLVNIQPQDLNFITIKSENVFIPENKNSQQNSPDNRQFCIEINIIAVQKFSPESNICPFDNSDDQLIVEDLSDITMDPLNPVHEIAADIVKFVRTSTSCIEIPKPSQTFKNSLNLSQQSREFSDIHENPQRFLNDEESSSATFSIESENLSQRGKKSLEDREIPKKKLDSREYSSSSTSSIDSDQEQEVNFLEPTELFFFEEAQNS
jgi:hypothetical protein